MTEETYPIERLTLLAKENEVIHEAQVIWMESVERRLEAAREILEKISGSGKCPDCGMDITGGMEDLKR